MTMINMQDGWGVTQRSMVRSVLHSISLEAKHWEHCSLCLSVGTESGVNHRAARLAKPLMSP